eukprot:15408681-Alexandrium_andersonii.AAC.1
MAARTSDFDNRGSSGSDDNPNAASRLPLEGLRSTLPSGLKPTPRQKTLSRRAVQARHTRALHKTRNAHSRTTTAACSGHSSDC